MMPTLRISINLVVIRLLSKPPPKRQGRIKNERETGVYIEVNEDFELIFSQKLAFGGGLERSLLQVYLHGRTDRSMLSFA